MCRKVIVIGVIIIIAGISIQFTGIKVTNPPVTGKIEIPNEVEAILKRSCFDCHSNETNLRWYDKIAPISWMVANDVNQARKRYNFSNWQKMSKADQAVRLWEIYNFVDAGLMPLRSYSAVHPSTEIAAADIAVLKKYVNTLSIDSKGDTAKTNAAARQLKQWQAQEKGLSKLPSSPNGIQYLRDYKNWQVMSTTSRFDNGTMCVIYGNEIAIQALKQNKITPWPNGSRLAKVVWDKLEDNDGNVITGKFLNIQYMIKDDKRFTGTEGWGFARFDTPALIPYGTTSSYDIQCINCHQVVKQNGFVFNIPTIPQIGN